jgi:hypothetical protein
VSSRPDPEWDETEVEWMRALAWYRDEYLCPCGCGLPRDVTHDPMTEFRVLVHDPVRCHVRTALTARQRAYADRPGSRPDGLLWSVSVPGADPHHEGDQPDR